MCLPMVVVQEPKEGFPSLDNVRLNQNWMLGARTLGILTTCLRFAFSCQVWNVVFITKTK